jgi:L-phenylalanine/L-methionine N-acetyltransferase
LAVEGLEIRRAEPDDCSALYEMFRSPKVYEGTLQLPYPSREQWRKRITDTDSCYSLVAASGEHVIGMLTIDTFPHKPRRRHVGIIGISVTDTWQGKGVGNALMQAGVDLADKWLNLTRLELEVYADNEPAIRLYERFGFEHEGRLRQHAFRDGLLVDSIVMGRLRP